MQDRSNRHDEGAPHVTVLMPVYNALPYLPAAVDSILRQTHNHLTLLALDDGSTDGSLEYLQQQADPRIQLFHDGQHHGLGALLNIGIGLAKGSLIARMDADDVCSPNRLALQVEFLQEHREVVAVGTQFEYMGELGRRGFSRHLPLGHNAIHNCLRSGILCVIHGSLMMRTEALRRIGGYRLMGAGEDWEMFLRLAEVGDFANIPDITYNYRLHSTNTTSLQLRMTQRRIRFACACAEARRRKLPEPDEATWLSSLGARPRAARLAEALDLKSLSHYFKARNLVLNGRPIQGYGHLALAALTGPRRLANRLANRVTGMMQLQAVRAPPPTVEYEAHS